MRKPSRETAALFVFALSAIGILAASLGYLAIGHSWNAAASKIDDANGTLESYTAIVFEGTNVPYRTGGDNPAPPADTASGPKAPAPGAKQVPGPSASDGQAEAPTHDFSDGSIGPYQKELNERGFFANAWDQFFGRTGRELDSANLIKPTLAQVEAEYRDKGALTMQLSTTDTARYDKGIVLTRGSFRYGVIAIAPGRERAEVNRRIAELHAFPVDFVIAITPEKRVLDDVRGVDVAILTRQNNPVITGERIGDTYFMSTPPQGVVGVLLVSPQKVLTSRSVDSLTIAEQDVLPAPGPGPSPTASS